MELLKISRSYRRSIELIKSSGEKTYITSECMLEGSIETTDNIPECSKNLLDMCKAEVVATLKEAKTQIEKDKTSKTETKTANRSSFPKLT